MYEYKVWAYAKLVQANLYILDEKQRTNQSQILVPSDYTVAVSQKLLEL